MSWPLRSAIGDRQHRRRADRATLRVLPAHERLCPEVFAARQVELRLKADPQAAVARVERDAQIVGEREVSDRVPVAAGVVGGDPNAAALGVGHRDLGAPRQLAAVQGIVGEGGEPDAGAHSHVDRFDLEHIVERMQQAGGDELRVDRVLQHRGELVAAHAHELPVFAECLAQPLRDRPQQRVASMMAERLVE